MDINIEIKKISIEIGIRTLKMKRDELYAKKLTPKKKAGSGDVAAELEMIGRSYEQIYDAMTLLFDNTISFLTNAQDSLIAADKSLANTFKVI